MKRIDEYWYQASPVMVLLVPLAWLFCAIAMIRKRLYQNGILRSIRMPVPVIVVGNITAGGSGKTPLVIMLVKLLQKAGYSPGVVSRGYGGKASNWPQQVRQDSDPYMVGDEPVLIARRCDVPMAVGPDRVKAALQLLEYNDCDIIISDDGLQHYALQRDIEFAVVDGVRRYGNGFCLPAGPLREPVSRLKEVDFIVSNGIAMRMEYPMELHGTELINLETGEHKPLDTFKGKTVHAIAGIGNPQRFFDVLNKNGLNTIEHPKPDHHKFSDDDLSFDDEHDIIMTEKDMVKCDRFTQKRMWYLPVNATLDERLAMRLLAMIKELS